MKTYIALVTFNSDPIPSADVSIIGNQIGDITYSMDAVGLWLLTCTGAFANDTACSIQANGGEVAASPPLPQQLNIAKANNNVVAISFGNGADQQDPNASPYRIEINVKE